MPQRDLTMSDVSREEFMELVRRQDAAEQRDREMSHDIKQIRTDTSEVVEMFRALSGGFKVLQGLGKLARPIGYIAATVAAVAGAWATVRGVGK